MKQFKTHFINKESLPLVIEPSSPMDKAKFFQQVAENRTFIKEKLLSIGGILFRNFPVENVDDFASLIDAIGLGKCVDYIGGDSPRVKIKGEIYTSTEAPPTMKIPLHNELSFVKYFPKHIFFYCDTPSPQGGETIIADCRKIYADIDEKVKQRFATNGLKYISRYYYRSKVMEFLNSIRKGHKTWIDVFETTDKKEVEEKCIKNDFGFRWNKNDWIEISQERPAIIAHPETQDQVWFNQAHLYDFNPRLLGWKNYVGAKLVYMSKHTKLHEVYFANGNEIPRKDFYHILDTLDKNTIAFPWKKGDVMVLDNILTMHGRAPFTGKRRVLAAMSR